ncbi:MAG: endonuclease/exonuclease/phosphatase family protein [Mariniblastus sp.]|nr:endonuclease/exonuclease/phosphatase family protein [Mariniblastus sp.]
MTLGRSLSLIAWWLACLPLLGLPLAVNDPSGWARQAAAQEQADQATAVTERLQVLNWNVLYAFNHGKAVDEGVQWIRELSPDVVALQELNGLNAESLKRLASRWGHEHAVILKEQGFPVGLTSSQPIELIDRQVEGFHHGYLHARTAGVDFFVVHFWPGKDHEAEQVASKIRTLLESGRPVVLLGDFNNHSRRDQAFLDSRSAVTPRYGVVDLFESIGLVDLVQAHRPDQKYSCPSPVTIPRWSADLPELQSKRQRIDFIFADQALAKSARTAEIRVSDRLGKISDHYPLVVEFERGVK